MSHMEDKTNKPAIRIGVISDVVCPWCYIGKRRLEKAIEESSDKFDFTVEYFPFELNPQLPEAGVDQKDYLTKKFGGEERYRQVTGHVTQLAAEEGLQFNFDVQKISPNTRKAHRIIQLAKEDGKQPAVVEAFFKAHFTDGIDLSKNEMLAEVASQAGMDRKKVEAFLRTETGAAEVEFAEREIRQLGISGVPFYIIDNKFGISGAQSSGTFMKAFEDTRSAPVTSGDAACDVDGTNC